MRKTLVVALSLVFVAALVWVLSDRPPHDLAPPVALPPDEAAAAAAPQGAADADRQPVARTAATAAPIPDDATWIEVLVVDLSTGQPAAGADVWSIDAAERQRALSTSDLSNEERLWLYRDIETCARRFGRRTTTDERGVTRVRLAAVADAVALHDGRFGSAVFRSNVPPPPEGYRLEIAPDIEVQVQVVDVDGTPMIGVPLAVSQHAADGSRVRDVPRHGWLEVARTEAPDAIARLRHLQQWNAATEDGAPAVVEWRVRPHLPGCPEPPSASFDLELPPTEPLVLTLPAFGVVKVRVEWEGRPLPASTAGASVVLYQGAPGDYQAPNNGWHANPDDDGWTRFPWVPIGARYSVKSYLGLARLHAEFEGPLRQGHEVTVRLPVGADHCVLTGRLLNRDRELVREQNVNGQFKTSSAMGGMHVRTDAQGRFHVFLGEPGEGTELERFALEWGRLGEIAQHANVAPRPLRPGLIDVGDVVLSSGEIVVAGRLVTAHGPFRGSASLMIEQHVEDEDGVRWENVRDVVQRRDPETAEFEVRGTVGPGRYRLMLRESGGHLPVEPIEFTPGMTDVVVRLDLGVRLGANLRAPPGAASGLRGVLVPRANRHAAPTAQDARAAWNDRGLVAQPWSAGDDRYQMTWSPIPAGTYDLHLRVWADSEPALVIEDVVAPPPEGGDPRLADADLRERVAVLRLRFVDPSGAAIESSSGRGRLFPRGLPAASDWPGFEIQGDTATIVTRKAPIDLIAAVPGYRPRELRGLTDAATVTVRLEPWPTVELVFGDWPPLPAEVSVTAMVTPIAPRASGGYFTPSSRGSRRSLEQATNGHADVVDGRARIAVGDGPHMLRVGLRREGVRRWVPLADIEPPELTAEVVGPVLQVHVPAASWQEALDRLAQPR